MTAIPTRPDLAPTGVTVADGDREVRITVAPGRTAAGVLRDAAGTPFPDVTVTPWVAGIGRSQLSLPERRTRTDAGGRFAISGLPDRRITANFVGPGLGSLRSQPLALDRETVVIGEPAGVILGRVVDGAGQPVPELPGHPREVAPGATRREDPELCRRVQRDRAVLHHR